MTGRERAAAQLALLRLRRRTGSRFASWIYPDRPTLQQAFEVLDANAEHVGAFAYALDGVWHLTVLAEREAPLEACRKALAGAGRLGEPVTTEPEMLRRLRERRWQVLLQAGLTGGPLRQRQRWGEGLGANLGPDGSVRPTRRPQG